MQIHTNKSTKILKKIPTKACLLTSGALLVAGSIGATYCLTQASTPASASGYSLTNSSVVLDGVNDGSATVALTTSVARAYTAANGVLSLHEIVSAGAAQTEHLSLSSMTYGGLEEGSINAGNGAIAWSAGLNDVNGASIAAGGNVFTATYTVNKNTPAGTYKISFSDGSFMYQINGSEVDDDNNGNIASEATITVTRNETGNNTDTGDDSNNANTGGETNNNEGDSSEPSGNSESETEGSTNDSSDDNSAVAAAETSSDSDSGTKTGGLAVPDTGRVSQDNKGASAIVISVVSVVAVAVLSVAAIQLKNHKKIDFKKA